MAPEHAVPQKKEVNPPFNQQHNNMNTATHTRNRFPIGAEGKSGKRTLLAADLKQDKAAREALKQQDMLAYLAAGGMQEPTTILTPELAMQQEINSMFDTNSWDEYAGSIL
jgi:hypothetical protein